ncbi:hypothetical protein [Nocardioides sp.]|uniref:hypothetical protein n=1 Tax=Nocardioides sp. TaxID=35761 RepID=UPI0025DDBF6C|nr:hypothetical protein [Nocardioides sp.]
MSDLTPPPDEPMGDQSRARIRAELLRTAHEGRAESRTRRRLVPVIAAAAVLVVAGVTAWAVQAGEGGVDGAPAGPLASTWSTDPTPSPPATRETPSPRPPDQRAGAGDCRAELANTLSGAELAARVDDHTSFWVRGDRFVLCDVRDRTTIHRALPVTPADSVETFRVSTRYVPAGRGAFDVIRVAGGAVPEGAMAYDVEYTFPDGTVVPAETVTGADGRTWWRVEHTSSSDGGNEMSGPPITVRVSLSGVQRTYRLDWASDTCAQANHGC